MLTKARASRLPTVAHKFSSNGGMTDFMRDLRQRISSLLASTEPSAEDAAVTRDLIEVFGMPVGYRWTGRVFTRPPIPDYPKPDVAEYRLEMVLTDARELPQMIPSAYRYGNEASFAESYLTSLWVVRISSRR